MQKQKMYILFDDVILTYSCCFVENWEEILVKDLTKYFKNFYQNSEIIIITNQEIHKIIDWFIKHDLFQFVESISKPEMQKIKL